MAAVLERARRNTFVAPLAVVLDSADAENRINRTVSLPCAGSGDAMFLMDVGWRKTSSVVGEKIATPNLQSQEYGRLEAQARIKLKNSVF